MFVLTTFNAIAFVIMILGLRDAGVRWRGEFHALAATGALLVVLWCVLLATSAMSTRQVPAMAARLSG